MESIEFYCSTIQYRFLPQPKAFGIIPSRKLNYLAYYICFFTKLLSEIGFRLSGMESIVGATIEDSIVRIKMFQVYFLRA